MKHLIQNWFERIPVNWRAAIGLLGLLFVFYPDLFLVVAAPLTGDHLEQHYPWAYLLAQSVKQFKLPFWTDLIHCGFPLVAESQVGAFYLPNLLMYFCLPFQAAYSYMNLVHWLIAGFGTYLYAKQMKLGAMPAFVAAIIFTFGSAYGGAYYNMTSLKTICWFPVALYLLERYLEVRKSRWLLGLSVVVGQSMVAGYLQMAAFTWMIFAVYVVLRVLFFPDSSDGWIFRMVLLGRLVLSAVGAVVLALPQLFLTYQLAVLSNRSGLEEGYAYIGSMAPYILGTLFNPHLSLLATGNNLYAGYFSIFLVLIALFCRENRGTPFFRIWVTMALVALLLALGRWSPLYVALVKLTQFYSFRVPSKFLGFFCFGMAMLAALGFRTLWNGGVRSKVTKSALITLATASLVVFGGMTAGFVFLSRGRQFVLSMGEAYVKRFVYGQPGHPHSLERYLDVMSEFPDRILKFLSWNEPANIGAVIAALLCLLVVLIIVRKKYSRPVILFGILFLVIDLYEASFLDIRGDLASYKSALAPSPIVEILKKEKAAGNLGRVYGCRAPSQSLPLVPSQNMLYGIEDIGAYSPLVMSRYYETVGRFGNINDSNYAFTPTPSFIDDHLPILKFLNVSHILSAEKLFNPSLRLIGLDATAKALLYRNEGNRTYAFYVTKWEVFEDWKSIQNVFMANGYDPVQSLLLERSEFDKIRTAQEHVPVTEFEEGRMEIRRLVHTGFPASWEFVSPSRGFFVVAETFFPGVQAKLDGHLVPVLMGYGMFRAVFVENPGCHRVDFYYDPFPKERELS